MEVRMNTHTRLLPLSLILFACLTPAWALSNFSGMSEFDVVIRMSPAAGNDANASPVILDGLAFFDGQLDLFDWWTMKLAMSLVSYDIYPNAITPSPILDPANKNPAWNEGWTVNPFNNIYSMQTTFFDFVEFSTTLRLSRGDVIPYVSIFVGNFESPGGDMFFQKYLGGNPISSLLTRTRIDESGSPIYPILGLGGSFNVRFMNKTAAALYVYISPAGNGKDDTPYTDLNFDLRYAGVFSKVMFDIAAGASLEYYYAGQDDYPQAFGHIRFGLSALAGNQYGTSLLFQVGLARMNMESRIDPVNLDEDGKPTDVPQIDLSNVFLVLEPRIYSNGLRTDITIFAFPEVVYKNEHKIGQGEFMDDDKILYYDHSGKMTSERLLFTRAPLGVGITIHNDHVSIRNWWHQFGGAAVIGSTASLRGLVDGTETMSIAAQINFFWAVQVYNGSFSVHVSFDPLYRYLTVSDDGTELLSTQDPLLSLRFRLGYYVRF
ncbi:MAG: hypothetical protein Ta2A_11410 [Treponemataceae bacterium]|nr:MAG: hypothetical protein Ta2A_11410 [Treponemataceae bacterium]